MRSSFVRSLVIIVQIIALMVCTLTFEASPVSAQPADETPTVAPEEDDGTLTDAEMLSVQMLQQQRLALQQQATQLQVARQYFSDSLDGLLKQKSNIEAQISLKQREIDINKQLIKSIDAQISQTDRELIAREQALLVRRQEILTRFDALRQKLRALSKGGQLTTVQIMLSTDSFTSFLMNAKMAQRIAAADEEIIHGLEEELEDIQRERDMLTKHQQQLEESRKPFENAENSLEQTKNDLLSLLSEANQISDQLNQNLVYYRQQYLTLSQQQSFLQQQIADIVKDYDPGTLVAPTVMSWPAPQCTVITSSYKYRWGRWHYGIDIAAWGDSTGLPIVAAADGTVIFSGSDSSGYGNYVIVDHGYDVLGQRVVTMYAHASALYVSVGDVVFGGQTVIAAVGNTGNSTGPHLHFEVRVNGEAVDPIMNGYLSTAGISITD